MRKASWCLGLLVVALLLACPVLAVDEAAIWKDTTFKLEGDYQTYGKYFNERDINGYDGNASGQTDRVEAWLEHELRLMPTMVFKPDFLELHGRIDVGPYLFQSDHNDRIYISQDTENTLSQDVLNAGLATEAKKDYEKPRVEEVFLQMITPVGLFVMGRFAGGSEGVVWGIELPQAPGWTFALAWNKKNEEKWDYEDVDVPYTSPLVQNMDYLDRDDQDEFKALTWYENKDKTLKSEQWVDCRLGGSQSGARNMRIFIPQWRVNYNKDNVHYMHVIGSGFGMLAELPQMQQGRDMQTLIDNGVELNSLDPLHYDFPVVKVEDLHPVNGKTWVLAALFGYDIGKFTPEVAGFYMAGASAYNEIDGFGWDEYEPQGYRTPRKFKTLLIGEIEDKYYPTIANLATYSAFKVNDICFHNMSALKIGATYRPSEKWELFGQVMQSWRTNTKYYEKEYWDMFPIMFALFNQRVNATTGHQEVPFVFKRKDTAYYQDISNDLGMEIDGRVTYHLYDGLDISLLGAYFKTGDFYKDILTPKPYKVQWVDTVTMGTVGSATDLSGPYLGADQFKLSDVWTIQLKVDFKFKTS